MKTKKKLLNTSNYDKYVCMYVCVYEKLSFFFVLNFKWTKKPYFILILLLITYNY